jgi:4-oxalocrotonate tautomerase
MPNIMIDGPTIESLDVKRKLVKYVTKAAIEAYGIPSIVVLIRENPPENVGVDGELVIDRMKNKPKD